MARQFGKSTSGLRVLLLCVLSIVVVIIDTNTVWLNGVRNATSIVLRPVQSVANLPRTIEQTFSSALQNEPDIKIAYENLRKEYFELKSEALLLKALQTENTELRELLGASPRLEQTISLAELVSANVSRDSHSFIIGQGLRTGVFNGQAVVDDKGVVGQVTQVMPLTSRITLITDPGHALPASVERNGLRTVVQGTGSLYTLNVPFLNLNADIQEGDVLLSSGLGGRFPMGYPVAQVTAVRVIKDEAFMRVDATPIAALDKAQNVLLLSDEGAR